MEPMNPGDKNLTEQLNAAVDGVDAAPDLAGVVAGADRRRRRSRSISLGGAAAVVALGVGGVVMVSNRNTNELPAAQPDPVVVPLTTLPPGAEDSADATADTEPSADLPVPTIRLDGSFDYDPTFPGGVDPAEQYLDQTDEIYRRQMPGGYDLQVRQSRQSYGELFGIEWDLPTGSQAECLGNPAVFIGNPDGPAQWLSTWTVQQWWPVGGTEDFQITEHYSDETSNLILRTELAGVNAAIMQGNEVTDSAEFVDGVAVLEMRPFGDGHIGDDAGPMLSITTQSADGSFDVQTLPVYSAQYGVRSIPQDCLGPAFPGSELPDPGVEQPADPAGAEADIRERHALLVDRSLDDDQRPVDLLTDDTGVIEARAQMEAGTYAESADAAEYTIDGVVFVDADNAWFEYTIVAPTGTFSDRFGQAIFNGEVWQITRQTICQDLSLAGGQCDVENGTKTLRPPVGGDEDFDAAVQQWEQVNFAYDTRLHCNPLNPCGDFDLTRQLPEPGEQPGEADAARAEVVKLMESMYGKGALREQLDRIDDSTGIIETLDLLGEGSYADQVETATAIVDELVFTSPETAVFRYTLSTAAYTFTDRFGAAVRLDGQWKISRATICNDLSLGGSRCDS